MKIETRPPFNCLSLIFLLFLAACAVPTPVPTPKSTYDYVPEVETKYLSRGGLTVKGYQTVPVLSYHKFSKDKVSTLTVKEVAFEEQMKFLKDNDYNVITLDQLLNFLEFKGEIPEKSVVITFDDGWSSVYDIAYPILKKYGFPATLFVYTEFIGGKRALSWKEIKELAVNGIDIQCHSVTHRNLTVLNEKESFKDYFDSINREIFQSRQMIEKRINKKCKYLAYPYGASNKLVIALLKKHGYRGAFSVKRGSNPFFVNEYLIKRSMIYGKYDIQKFKKNLVVFKATELR